VFFNGLSNRVRLVVHQLETLKSSLSNRLCHVPHGQHGQHESHAAAREATRAVAGKLASQAA
jgi:biopolymer transport protein ExbB